VKEYERYLLDKHETPMSFAYNVSTLLRVIRQHERSTSAFTYTDHSFMELSHLGHIINLSMIK